MCYWCYTAQKTDSVLFHLSCKICRSLIPYLNGTKFTLPVKINFYFVFFCNLQANYRMTVKLWGWQGRIINSCLYEKHWFRELVRESRNTHVKLDTRKHFLKWTLLSKDFHINMWHCHFRNLTDMSPVLLHYKLQKKTISRAKPIKLKDDRRLLLVLFLLIFVILTPTPSERSC